MIIVIIFLVRTIGNILKKLNRNSLMQYYDCIKLIRLEVNWIGTRKNIKVLANSVNVWLLNILCKLLKIVALN